MGSFFTQMSVDDEEVADGVPAPGAVFEALLKLADRYCAAIGVGQELMMSLFSEQSDWAFIIQIDALNETACRDIISRKLSLDGIEPASEEEISAFVSSLSYQGRSSIIRLLKMTGVPAEHTEFVEAIRKIRNTFAHDIRSVSRGLMSVIGERNDKTQLLKILSYVQEFDEDSIVQMFTDDPGVLRFVILQQCLTFLYLIHINLRDREEGAKLAGEK